MEKTIYIPGDLVMTNGIPIGMPKRESFTRSQKVMQINMQKWNMEMLSLSLKVPSLFPT